VWDFETDLWGHFKAAAEAKTAAAAKAAADKAAADKADKAAADKAAADKADPKVVTLANITCVVSTVLYRESLSRLISQTRHQNEDIYEMNLYKQLES